MTSATGRRSRTCSFSFIRGFTRTESAPITLSNGTRKRRFRVKKVSTILPTKHVGSIEPECQGYMKVGGICYSTTTVVGYVNGDTHQCEEHSYLRSYRHSRRPFLRKNGFPFFNLPPEIRRDILELLLVKEKVALTPNTHQRVEEMMMLIRQRLVAPTLL